MHVISLSRAWQLISIENQQCLLTRNFNRPTGLGPQQPVWLACESTSSASLLHAEFNNRHLPLPTGAADQVKCSSTQERAATLELTQHQRWPVTQLLCDQNRIVIKLLAHELEICQRLQTARLCDLSPWLQFSLQIETS
jgi:hypothetical protein